MKKFILLILAVLILSIVGAVVFFWQSENRVVTNLTQAKESAISKMIAVNKRGNVFVLDRTKYQILYLKEFDQFLISILQNPFEKIRQEAEEEFLKITKTNKETACQLNVTITTPRFANPDLAGKIFYLSFCETNGQ